MKAALLRQQAGNKSALDWRNLLAVALGGAIGSSVRYLLASYVYEASHQHKFPFGILTVNLIGSFVLGVISHIAWSTKANAGALYLGLTVGMLGGFTTYATFSHDIFSLLHRGHVRLALAYMVSTLVLCLLGVWAGYGVGKLIYPAPTE